MVILMVIVIVVMVCLPGLGISGFCSSWVSIDGDGDGDGDGDRDGHRDGDGVNASVITCR